MHLWIVTTGEYHRVRTAPTKAKLRTVRQNIGANILYLVNKMNPCTGTKRLRLFCECKKSTNYTYIVAKYASIKYTSTSHQQP